jgi:hypothetical protein
MRRTGTATGLVPSHFRRAGRCGPAGPTRPPLPDVGGRATRLATRSRAGIYSVCVVAINSGLAFRAAAPVCRVMN